MKRFCQRDYGKVSLFGIVFEADFGPFVAIQAQVMARESVDGWVKYRITVMAIYHRRKSTPIPYGNVALWLSSLDFLCKCPDIKLGRKYLILGE